MSDWNWQDAKRAWRGFDPAKHKRGLLVLLLVGLSIGLFGWAEWPSNGVFHSYQCVKTPIEEAHNLPCGDPVTTLWTGQHFSDFNTKLATFGANYVQLNPNSTDSAIALSVTTIGDLSPVAGKDLVLSVTWHAPAISATTAIWGFYLTTNSTFPSQHGYNPVNDAQVALMVKIGNLGAGNFAYQIFTQKKAGESIAAEDTGNCGQAGSAFICNTLNLDPTANNININPLLNYTGTSAATICGANGQGAGCSYMLDQSTPLPPATSSQTNTQTLPWFQFQSQQYYFGVFAQAQLPITPQFFIGIGGGSTPFSPQIYSQTPTVAITPSLSPTIDTGGFFGPVLKALIVIGVFVLNAVLGFVSFIAPALQTALNFMQTQITSLLNLIGNALGFGNVGTDLANFLNAMINFFTNQLPQYIGDFPSYVTNFLSLLSIEFPFLAPVFTIANAILAFGVAGIAEAIVIFTIGLQMFLFGYGTLMVAAYFLYVGDDGIGGFFTYLGTLEALSFKILNIIATITNLGLDFIVHVISLIPKPVIQMGAGHLPRLPTVDSSASISFPKLDFAEARNGNLIVYWLWCMGLWFVAWFESRNPSLPGSIGALDPAVASNIRQIAAFIPIMQAATLVSGGLLLIWFTMLPLRLAGIDVTEAPVGASLGRLTGPGPGGVSVHAGKKHLIGKAKKIQQQIEAGKESKVKKKQEAKEAIEKRKKELEEKKRSEELRKEELARKPTGKNLQGPRLQ